MHNKQIFSLKAKSKTYLPTTYSKKNCTRSWGVLQLSHIVLPKPNQMDYLKTKREDSVLIYIYVIKLTGYIGNVGYLNWQRKHWRLSRFYHRFLMFADSFPYCSWICMTLQKMEHDFSWNKSKQISPFQVFKPLPYSSSTQCIGP